MGLVTKRCPGQADFVIRTTEQGTELPRPTSCSTLGRFLTKGVFVEREIKLDGGEVSVIKALGLSGSFLNGKLLVERVGEVEFAEMIETLNSLIDQGYVLSSKVHVYSKDDLERAAFRVNPSYARDLKDALRPGGRRREERARRPR